jgi:Collagen triple helix repeat (20 copies)
MKKFTLALIVFSLMRVTLAYAESNTPITIQNFFLGNAPSSNLKLNQVLALLVGPEGKPGPAGVAGRDGFVGMNGVDGKDGLPGAPGVVGAQGPAGASVIASIVAVGSSECSGLGGTKFVIGTVTTFACNGSGGSGGGTFGFGQGTVNIGTCDSDATVSFTFPVRWSGSDFFFREIVVSDIDGNCIGANLRIYLKIKSGGTLFLDNGSYQLGDVVICTLALTEAASSVTSSPRTSLTNSFTLGQALQCTRESATGASRPNIALGEIVTRDLVGTIGFEIA